LAVAHNGIVENHRILKDELLANGHSFSSETDSEVIPHLIEEIMASGISLLPACRIAFKRLAGSQAILVLSLESPNTLIATHIGNAGGIALATRHNEALIASDVSALMSFSNKVLTLSSGEILVTYPDKSTIIDLNGEIISRRTRRISLKSTTKSKSGYKHFMIKEIMEQPKTIRAAYKNRVFDTMPPIQIENFPFTDTQIRRWDRAVLIGMGTSYHAAQIGRIYMEKLALMPTEVDNSSEFRYRDPIINKKTLAIFVTQSGETADTIAGIEEAKAKGATTITLTNCLETQATRLSDHTIYLESGPEISVASTKTFVSSIMCLYLLAMTIGRARNTLTSGEIKQNIHNLKSIPRKISDILSVENQYIELARKYSHSTNFLYLGRGINHPVATEGALKLKEISYIHAEGYAAGEMKHGPISLIDQKMPVVIVSPNGPNYQKTVSTIAEVSARGGRTIVITNKDTYQEHYMAEDVIYIPTTTYLLSPILSAIPLQLLAYHIAVALGRNIDQPRNLAKSVTVE
jgi:glucosamine--fructose-6-phosphate aminotransferase (isomerizing)